MYNPKDDKALDEIEDETRDEYHAENERYAPLSPDTPTEIDDWRDTIKINFPELILPAEVGLSVVAQLLIEDIKNPFALVYVDVPSSGKTIALNFFSTIKELAFTTDNFTPAAFVSHAANRKPEQLLKIDMLPQIRYKTMIVRDLAPIFAKKDEDVQSMLGILIRVLDGEGLETNSGVYGKRGYVGDYLFMMLCASTQIRPRVWKVMGNLGSRLFFLNINGTEKSEEVLAEQLKISCRDKEIVCRKATDNFLKTLWSKYPQGIQWNKNGDTDQLIFIIARFAKVLAHLRSAINVWKDGGDEKGKYNHTIPITEMPDRLTQLLYNFARGHAVACGREAITIDDLTYVAKVTIDSAPPNRAKIFKLLLENDGVLSTKKAMDKLKCSRPTALKEMQQLVVLAIVETETELDVEQEYVLPGRPEQEITLKDEYAWFLSDECKGIMAHEQK